MTGTFVCLYIKILSIIRYTRTLSNINKRTKIILGFKTKVNSEQEERETRAFLASVLKH